MEPKEWVGWFRAAGERQWRAVVRAETWAECWDRLAEYSAAAGGHSESVVLREGRTPGVRKPYRA